MGSVSAEQTKFHSSHQLFLSKKGFRDIEIPPRKLLGRSGTTLPETVFMDSPNETLLQKFLPYNSGVADDDDNDDPYSTDDFRMYEFKVRRCNRNRSHDWTDCPFAHPGEKARRRDPQRYHYSGTMCADFRRGGCSRGDNCEFAHGVFECWLHPARYRMEACKDGNNCKRKVCFFAHTVRQLRVLPPQPHYYENPPSSPANSPSEEKRGNTSYHCCAYCHNITASPTSSNLSPPHSRAKSKSMSGFSPISRFGDRLASVDTVKLNQVLSYKDAVTELMSSFGAMNANEASSRAVNNNKNLNLSRVDDDYFNGDDQQQFVLSPPGSGLFFTEDRLNENGLAGPDIGWVNDLLT